MDISFRTRNLRYAAPVFVKGISSESSHEIVIPDSLPEAESIMDVNACVCLRSKEPQSGRCVITAGADVTLLYRAAQTGQLQHCEATFPVEIIAEEPAINSDCLVIASVSAVFAEGRCVSGRKVILKLCVLCNAECYSPCEAIITEEPDENVYETLIDSAVLRLNTSVDEKRFELSDNFSLDGPAAYEIISGKVSAKLTDVSLGNDRVTASGILKLSLLYKAAGVEEAVFTEHEEIFKVDSLYTSYGTAVRCRPMLALTSVYITNEPGLAGDGKSIGFDISGVLQYSIEEDVHVSYLADMYSTKQKVINCVERLTFTEALKENETETVAQENISIDEGVQQYLSASFEVGAASVSRDAAGECGCDGVVTVMYKNGEGAICCRKEKFRVTAALRESKAHCIGARAGSIVLIPNSGGCTVKLTVVFTELSKSENGLDYISQAVCRDAESDGSAPALWITRYTEDKTMWEICKQHGVSESFIRSVNMIKPNEKPEHGMLLLIPKA